jgi:hypothetical protein
MKSRSFYIGLAAALGLVSLILTVAFGGHPSSAHTVISLLLDAVLLVVAFLFGRASKKQGGKPLWNGALAGAVFGLIGALGSFFVKIDASMLKNTNLTADQIDTAVQWANSPVSHIISVVVAIILFGVLGLIAGVIGGATTKREGEPEGV